VSYVKSFKVVSDFALGFQTLNQALENNRALLEQVDAKHATGRTAWSSSDTYLENGRHDDPLVARTSADFEVDTTGTVIVARTLIRGPMIQSAPVNTALGQWKFVISTPQFFGAVACAKGVNPGAGMYATCFCDFSTTGPHTVTVTTWNVASGLPAFYDFSLVVWAEGVS
jgi:hypothetical protein